MNSNNLLHFPHFSRSAPQMPMGQPLPQFPQPTRPEYAYNVDPVPETDPNNEEEYHHPESLSLPKPETHFESMDTECSEPAQCFTGSDCDETSSSSISLSPPTGKTPKGEKEAVDELLTILVECMEELNTRSRESLLRKFFSEIEKEERLERFIVERLKQSRVKAISDLCERLPERNNSEEAERESVNRFSSSSSNSCSDTEEEKEKPSLTRSISVLSQKLERFKVKTLDLGGPVVVKEEEEEKK